MWSALGGGPGGYSVTPTDRRFVWGGYYEERSLIWWSRWVTTTGIIECQEALAFPGDPQIAVVLRRIVAVDSDAEVDVRLSVRAGFGSHPMTLEDRRDDGFSAASGSLRVLAGTRRATSRLDAQDSGGKAVADIPFPATPGHRVPGIPAQDRRVVEDQVHVEVVGNRGVGAAAQAGVRHDHVSSRSTYRRHILRAATGTVARQADRRPDIKGRVK